jgi:hypothetical protein
VASAASIDERVRRASLMEGIQWCIENLVPYLGAFSVPYLFPHFRTLLELVVWEAIVTAPLFVLAALVGRRSRGEGLRFVLLGALAIALSIWWQASRLGYL